MSMGRMRNPIIRNLDDLEPAKLYEQDQVADANKRVFSIMPVSAANTTRKTSRLMFRTDNFRVRRLEDIVVLSLSGFDDWFYILYFPDPIQANNFVECITNFETNPDIALDIPHDLQSYIETGMSPTYAQSESSSEPGQQTSATRPLNWSGKQPRSERDPSRSARSRSHGRND